MKLRTRAVSAGDANLALDAGQDLREESIQQNASRRSVLGDVSNKRAVPSDESKRAAKKPRKSADSSIIDESTNENVQNRGNRGRRISARLRDRTRKSEKKLKNFKTSASNYRRKASGATTDSCKDDEPQNKTQDEILIVPSEDIILPLSQFKLQRLIFDGASYTIGCAPCDQKHRENALEIANYVTDLYQHLYHAETISAPGQYMQDQKDINARMRAILIDWLVEVHMKFRLVPETLYLCVNIIDRYCNRAQVKRSRLQLVGVTALLIACKYEEIYPPEVRDCVYITDRAYDRQEVLEMEQDILNRLEFKISVPTAYPFLVRFLNVTEATPWAKMAAHYYMERTLQEHDLLQFRPSLVSAACVILALNNVDLRKKEENLSDDDASFPATPGMHGGLIAYTGFNPSELLNVAKIIAGKVAEEPVTASKRQLVAVKRKYDNRKYHHISTAVPNPSELEIGYEFDTGCESDSDDEMC